VEAIELVRRIGAAGAEMPNPANIIDMPVFSPSRDLGGFEGEP